MLTLTSINLHINLRGRDFTIEQTGSKKLDKLAQDNICIYENQVQFHA